MTTPKLYPNLFKNSYPSLKGKDWLKNVSADDLQAFTHLGFSCSDYGRKGGNIRAQNAKRDARGRFTNDKL